MAKRKNYSPEFKAKAALAALSNEKTVAELSMEHGIHQNLINKWKAQLIKGSYPVSVHHVRLLPQGALAFGYATARSGFTPS